MAISLGTIIIFLQCTDTTMSGHLSGPTAKFVGGVGASSQIIQLESEFGTPGTGSKFVDVSVSG